MNDIESTLSDFEKVLSLDAPMMTEVLKDSNYMIQKLISDIISKNTDSGTVTIKLSFSLDDEFIPGREPAKKLSFKHKISNTIPVKSSVDGEKLNDSDELEFVNGKWILMPITGAPQRTLLDQEGEDD